MLLDKSAVYLVLDASTPVVHVGLLKDKEWLALKSLEGNALESIYSLTNQVLALENLEFEDLSGFIFCEGPGSLLGIRLVAIAIRAWNLLYDKPLPVYAYKSLLLAKSGLEGSFSVIAPYRKHSWFVTHHDDEEIYEIDGKALDALESPLYQVPLKGKKHDRAAQLDYALTGIPQLFYNEGFIRETENVDAYLIREQKFVKWDRTRHKSPKTS